MILMSNTQHETQKYYENIATTATCYVATMSIEERKKMSRIQQNS